MAIGVAVVSMQSAFDDGALKRPAWAVVSLILLTALPLAFRRVRPVAVFAVTLAAAVVSVLVFESFQVLGALIALYTVARYCDRTTSLGAVGAGVVASVIPAVAKGSEDPLFAAVAGVGFVVVWAAGRRSGSREAELRAAHEAAAHAAEMERARIARELHDVISHNVSVMVVQAAAGRDVFDSRPRARARGPGAIELPGREALGELRRLLSVVREPDGEARGELRAPQPGLGRLPALADQVRTAGLDVRLHLDYPAARCRRASTSRPPGGPGGADQRAQARRRVRRRGRDPADRDAGSSSRDAMTAAAARRWQRRRGPRRGGHARARAAARRRRSTAGPRPEGGFAIHASIPLDGAPR